MTANLIPIMLAATQPASHMGVAGLVAIAVGLAAWELVRRWRRPL
jgi:hypothetical protein